MRNVTKYDLHLCVSIVALALLLLVMRCNAQQYEYRGVYPAQAVFTNLCENCYLQLPAEFLESNLVLSVSTDKEKVLERALVASAKSAGWDLKKMGKTWKAEPVQNEGNVVYISCLTNEPSLTCRVTNPFSVRSTTNGLLFCTK